MKEPAHDVALSSDGSRILLRGHDIPTDKVLAVHIGISSDIAGLIVTAALAAIATLYSLYAILFSSKSLVWLYLVAISLVVLGVSLKLAPLIGEKTLYIYVLRLWGVDRIGSFSDYEEAERAATSIAEMVEKYREVKLPSVSEELRPHFQDTVLVGNSATLNGALLTVGAKSMPVASIRSLKLSTVFTDVQLWAWAFISATVLVLWILTFVVMAVLGVLTSEGIDVLALTAGLVGLLGYVLQQIFAPRVYKVNIQADNGAGIVYKTTHKNKAQDLVELIKSRMERNQYEARTITVKRRDRER